MHPVSFTPVESMNIRAAHPVARDSTAYLGEACGHLVTAAAYLLTTAIFTALSVLTLFKVDGLEKGRVKAWVRTQHHTGQFKAYLACAANPDEAPKLLQEAQRGQHVQQQGTGLLKRAITCLDEAIFKGFLDNSEGAQKIKLLAAALTVGACYKDYLKVPLAVTAAIFPLVGIRRLGFFGTVTVALPTAALIAFPGLNTFVSGVFNGAIDVAKFIKDTVDNVRAVWVKVSVFFGVTPTS